MLSGPLRPFHGRVHCPGCRFVPSPMPLRRQAPRLLLTSLQGSTTFRPMRPRRPCKPPGAFLNDIK